MILTFEAADRAARLAEHPTFPSVIAEERLTTWDGFARKLVYRSAYDGRHEPENYGIHCAELILILERDGRAVEGGVMTGWHMPHNERAVAEHEASWLRDHPTYQPMHGLNGLHVGHHSPTPPRYWSDDDEWDHEGPTSTDCDITGGVCYFDCSGLAGNDFAVALAGEGWMAAWEMLRDWYRHSFLESDGIHYMGRVYTGFNSRTEGAPLWSAYTRGNWELERERRLRRREDAIATHGA